MDRFFMFVSLVAFLLAGCNTQPEPRVIVVEVTREVPVTVVVTATPEPTATQSAAPVESRLFWTSVLGAGELRMGFDSQSQWCHLQLLNSCTESTPPDGWLPPIDTSIADEVEEILVFYDQERRPHYIAVYDGMKWTLFEVSVNFEAEIIQVTGSYRLTIVNGDQTFLVSREGGETIIEEQ